MSVSQSQLSDVTEYFLQKHLFLKDEWLRVVAGYLSTTRFTSIQLCKEVFHQWLHSDISESTDPVFVKPPGKVGYISGYYIMQILSVVDIGSSYWSQYRGITSVSDNYDFFDIISKDEVPTEIQHQEKAKRMLMFELTDGNSNIKAIEFKFMPTFHGRIPPGAKILLLGNLKMRNDILFLTEGNCQLLGGHLESAVFRNRQEAVLGRLLNMKKYDNVKEPGDADDSKKKIEPPSFPTATRQVPEVVTLSPERKSSQKRRPFAVINARNAKPQVGSINEVQVVGNSNNLDKPADEIVLDTLMISYVDRRDVTPDKRNVTTDVSISNVSFDVQSLNGRLDASFLSRSGRDTTTTFSQNTTLNTSDLPLRSTILQAAESASSIFGEAYNNVISAVDATAAIVPIAPVLDSRVKTELVDGNSAVVSTTTASNLRPLQMRANTKSVIEVVEISDDEAEKFPQFQRDPLVVCASPAAKKQKLTQSPKTDVVAVKENVFQMKTEPVDSVPETMDIGVTSHVQETAPITAHVLPAWNSAQEDMDKVPEMPEFEEESLVVCDSPVARKQTTSETPKAAASTNSTFNFNTPQVKTEPTEPADPVSEGVDRVFNLAESIGTTAQIPPHSEVRRVKTEVLQVKAEVLTQNTNISNLKNVQVKTEPGVGWQDKTVELIEISDTDDEGDGPVQSDDTSLVVDSMLPLDKKPRLSLMSTQGNAHSMHQTVVKLRKLGIVKIAEAVKRMKSTVGSRRFKFMAYMTEEVSPFQPEDGEWTMTIAITDSSTYDLPCFVSHDLLCSLIGMTPAEAIAIKKTANKVKKAEASQKLASLHDQIHRLDLIFEVELFAANRVTPKIVGLTTLYDAVFC